MASAPLSADDQRVLKFLQAYNYDGLASMIGSSIRKMPVNPLIRFYDSPFIRVRDCIGTSAVEFSMGRVEVATKTVKGIMKTYVPQQMSRIFFGNEAGCIPAVLYAAGYTPADLCEMWLDGTFDPEDLMTGKKRLPSVLSALHPTKDGAQHKGERFRDALEDLINQALAKKIKAANPDADGLPPADPALWGKDTPRWTLKTFTDTVKGYVGINAMVTPVTDKAEGVPMGMILDASNHPNLPIADAVLGSIAIFPEIQRVKYQWTDKDGKSHLEYISSRSKSLPRPYTEIDMVLKKIFKNDADHYKNWRQYYMGLCVEPPILSADDQKSLAYLSRPISDRLTIDKDILDHTAYVDPVSDPSTTVETTDQSSAAVTST